MKRPKQLLPIAAVLLAASLAACSHGVPKSPDVTRNVRNALSQAGFKNISIHEDRDTGVVTLSGSVATDAQKAQAQSVAETQAGGLAVANQIAVIPPNDAHNAKAMNSDLDKGIQHDLDAALIYNHLRDGVKYSVTNHVVTLTGNVDSQDSRQRAQDVAAAVPNVQQVVNELQVKNQKATASN
jgi:hyperosmotically inducible periplasmic protein